MSWQPEQPYQQLPKLPPSLDYLKTWVVLKACIAARVAIVELEEC